MADLADLADLGFSGRSARKAGWESGGFADGRLGRPVYAIYYKIYVDHRLDLDR